MFSQKMSSLLLCLIVLFVVGCEKQMVPNGITDGTDTDTDADDPVTVTPGDIPDDDTNPVGNVVLLTGDDENDQDAIEQAGADAYHFNSATIEGDTLTVSVSYGGGCETHEFTLFVEPNMDDGPFGTMIGISIAHNANLDMCEAWLTESYDFDLTPIKKKYQEQYKKDAGSVSLGIIADPLVTPPPAGFPILGDLIYEFTE